MEYVRVAETSELPPNKMMMVVAGGKAVLLANVDGSFYAIANKCTHLGGELAKGSLEGGVVTCPKHGARFDVKTGKAVTGARIGFLKMNARDQESYRVRVDGTHILVGISKSEARLSSHRLRLQFGRDRFVAGWIRAEL